MLSRMEHDSIGALNVPAEAYYGVQSMRAATNFQITHRPLHPVIESTAIVMVKKAADRSRMKSLENLTSKSFRQSFRHVMRFWMEI